MAGELGIVETEGTEKSQLVAGNFHAQKEITLKNGAGVLVRGTVLGINTTTYECEQLVPAAVDGTEVSRCILLEDADATSSAKAVQAFFCGEYRTEDIVWPGGITAGEKNAALLELQDRGIVIK